MAGPCRDVGRRTERRGGGQRAYRIDRPVGRADRSARIAGGVFRQHLGRATRRAAFRGDRVVEESRRTGRRRTDRDARRACGRRGSGQRLAAHRAADSLDPRVDPVASACAAAGADPAEIVGPSGRDIAGRHAFAYRGDSIGHGHCTARGGGNGLCSGTATGAVGYRCGRVLLSRLAQLVALAADSRFPRPQTGTRLVRRSQSGMRRLADQVGGRARGTFFHGGLVLGPRQPAPRTLAAPSIRESPIPQSSAVGHHVGEPQCTGLSLEGRLAARDAVLDRPLFPDGGILSHRRPAGGVHLGAGEHPQRCGCERIGPGTGVVCDVAADGSGSRVQGHLFRRDEFPRVGGSMRSTATRRLRSVHVLSRLLLGRGASRRKSVSVLARRGDRSRSLASGGRAGFGAGVHPDRRHRLGVRAVAWQPGAGDPRPDA